MTPNLLHLCLKWQHISQTCVRWGPALQTYTHVEHDPISKEITQVVSDSGSRVTPVYCIRRALPCYKLHSAYLTKSMALDLFSFLHPEDELRHLQCTCQVVDRSSLRVNNWCKGFGEDTRG